MKRLRKIVMIIVLCAAIITAISATNAEAEVRVTMTFAAGGAACGVYFFIYFSSRFTGDWHNKQSDATALFNHSPEGWQVRPPSLQFIEDRQKGHTPYADIIRIRF